MDRFWNPPQEPPPLDCKYPGIPCISTHLYSLSLLNFHQSCEDVVKIHTFLCSQALHEHANSVKSISFLIFRFRFYTTMNSSKIMKFSVRSIVVALVLLMSIILVGALTVFQEHNNLKSTTFITNQSLKMVMATVRFDNVSESVRSFPNLLVATLDFVSFDYNVTDGRLLVETWVRGSKEKHKHLFIGNGHNLVLTDTDDLTGVDVYLSEYVTVHTPKGYSLTTMY